MGMDTGGGGGGGGGGLLLSLVHEYLTQSATEQYVFVGHAVPNYLFGIHSSLYNNYSTRQRLIMCMYLLC